MDLWGHRAAPEGAPAVAAAAKGLDRNRRARWGCIAQACSRAEVLWALLLPSMTQAQEQR